MTEPEHEGFVYQIIVNGNSVLVMADQEDALKYIEEHFKGVPVFVLPIAIFKYR